MTIAYHRTKKVCMLNMLQMYDEASRGPYGAFKMILRSKDAALLASCASVLAVAALLIDPFSQLVLTFPSRPTSSVGQAATISVAKAFDANTQLYDPHGNGLAERELSCCCQWRDTC